MINAGLAGKALFNASNQAGAGAANITAAAALAKAGKPMNTAQIDKTARDFEAMFIAQMVEQMFGESLGDEAFGSSETDEVYKGMMTEQYGKQIANAGGIGIAQYVKNELLKLQEI